MDGRLDATLLYLTANLVDRRRVILDVSESRRRGSARLREDRHLAHQSRLGDVSSLPSPGSRGSRAAGAWRRRVAG
jgi:hypothetical protein